jgi:hypothetical protein
MGVVEFPRGSGAWHARVKYQGKQYWRRAANKTHARALYHEMKTLIRKGEFPPKREQRSALFADLLADYREAKRREGRAVMASDIGYTRLLQRFGGRRAAEITADDVDRWRRDLAETMAPATVNLHLSACCGRFFAKAFERDGLQPQPCPRSTRLKPTISLCVT